MSTWFNSMNNFKISIIIPVYNEERNIKALINNLKTIKKPYEIIFVDGQSTDKTLEIIKKDFILFNSPEKGRANQMNYGALKAKGDVLFFLHADSILKPDCIEKINETLHKGYKAGCFKIKFDSRSLLMKICASMSNFRVIFRNIAFGDQGIFIFKDYFLKLGGFASIPIMEDYKLSMDIKKDGEKIGLAKGNIITSERRFLKNGRLRTMWKMQRLQYMFRKGKDINKIAVLYKNTD